jgi:hypothetical protein
MLLLEECATRLGEGGLLWRTERTPNNLGKGYATRIRPEWEKTSAQYAEVPGLMYARILPMATIEYGRRLPCLVSPIRNRSPSDMTPP